jgi:peptidoglycan L-alanyl-D-glutamate endopeptidase CwlK
MDTPTQQRIALLHPKLRDEVTALVNKANSQLIKHSQIRIVQGLRTFAEQDALYAQGRTKPGSKVTNAKGGQSLHNYGVAIDFCLIIDGKEVSWDLKKDWDGDKIADWMEVVKVFRDASFEWGGTWKFKDNPHFQKTFNYSWQDLLEKYKSGDTFIDNGYKYVNL